ncbi:hypothetical protein GCM10022234_05910 [Aeromicrobium panaciterrae]
MLVLVLVAIAVALFAWWLLMLIEALKTPAAQWKAAGQSQVVYVILMVVLGVIGTILYIAVPRSQLRSVAPSSPTV